MKLARAEIKRAIEIKPNAHFGREKYQLMAMDWILACKTGKMKEPLGTFLDNREKWFDDFGDIIRAKRAKATAGLSGLVVLGAAWQSVDIFEALASSLQSKEGITLYFLAWRRTQELMNQGHKSMRPNSFKSGEIDDSLANFFAMDDSAAINQKNVKPLNALYKKLRAEAESWNAERQKYMLTRMKKGDHPDTNPKFWANWKPAAPPSLDVGWVNEKQHKAEERKRLSFWFNTVCTTLSLSFFIGIGWGIWRAVKRKFYA